MKDRKKKQKRGITPRKALAWAEKKIGKLPDKTIADSMCVSDRTIRRYVQDFDEFVRDTPEYQEACERIVKMIPKACAVYDAALNPDSVRMGNPDIIVANNIFKAAGILTEKRRIEGNFNLGSMSDADITRYICKALGLTDEPAEPASNDDGGAESTETSREV